MAFAAVWLLVTGYVIYMGLRQRQLEADMHMLQEEVQAKQK
jgi:CcmD family protein